MLFSFCSGSCDVCGVSGVCCGSDACGVSTACGVSAVCDGSEVCGTSCAGVCDVPGSCAGDVSDVLSCAFVFGTSCSISTLLSSTFSCLLSFVPSSCVCSVVSSFVFSVFFSFFFCCFLESAFLLLLSSVCVCSFSVFFIGTILFILINTAVITPKNPTAKTAISTYNNTRFFFFGVCVCSFSMTGSVISLLSSCCFLFSKFCSKRPTVPSSRCRTCLFLASVIPYIRFRFLLVLPFKCSNASFI